MGILCYVNFAFHLIQWFLSLKPSKICLASFHSMAPLYILSAVLWRLLHAWNKNKLPCEITFTCLVYEIKNDYWCVYFCFQILVQEWLFISRYVNCVYLHRQVLQRKWLSAGRLLKTKTSNQIVKKNWYQEIQLSVKNIQFDFIMFSPIPFINVILKSLF